MPIFKLRIKSSFWHKASLFVSIVLKYILTRHIQIIHNINIFNFPLLKPANGFILHTPINPHSQKKNNTFSFEKKKIPKNHELWKSVNEIMQSAGKSETILAQTIFRTTTIKYEIFKPRAYILRTIVCSVYGMVAPYYSAIFNEFPAYISICTNTSKAFSLFRVCNFAYSFCRNLFREYIYYLPHTHKNIMTPFDKILIFITFSIRGKTQIVFYNSHIGTNCD